MNGDHEDDDDNSYDDLVAEHHKGEVVRISRTGLRKSRLTS